jgi:hypothetical protein
VLYTINFTNYYQNGSKEATKEAKEGREGKERNHNRKEGNFAETLQWRSCDRSRYYVQHVDIHPFLL